MKKNTKNKRIWNSSCATSETQWEWNGMRWCIEWISGTCCCTRGFELRLGVHKSWHYRNAIIYHMRRISFKYLQLSWLKGIHRILMNLSYIWHCIVSHVHMVLRLLWRRSSDPTSYTPPPSFLYLYVNVVKCC